MSVGFSIVNDKVNGQLCWGLHLGKLSRIGAVVYRSSK